MLIDRRLLTTFRHGFRFTLVTTPLLARKMWRHRRKLWEIHRGPSHPLRIWIKDCLCFVAAILNFLYLRRNIARSASARSGTEITEIARSLLGVLIMWQGMKLKSQPSEFRFTSRGNLHRNLPKNHSVRRRRIGPNISNLIYPKQPEGLRYFGVYLNYPLSRNVSASWGPRKSEMLQVDWQIRSGSDSVACSDWSVLIPEVCCCIPEIEWFHKAKVKVKAKAKAWPRLFKVWITLSTG